MVTRIPITLFCLSLLFPLVSFAAPSYLVSPLVIDLDLEARDIVTKIITITNTGDSPVTIYPSINNISVNEGGMIEEYHSPIESDRSASLSSWMEFSRQGINLMIGATKTLEVTFRVHPSPVPGEYHAFLGFGYGRNRDEAAEQVKRGDAPGSIINATIADNKVEFLKLGKFIIDRFITGAGNQAAVYTIKNPGDESLTPKGEIIFYDSKGVEVASLPVNTDNQTINAGEEKEFAVEVPVDGLFGKYKAFLNIEYGNTERASVQDTSFFYVIPLKMLLSIFAALALLVVVLAFFVHKKYLDDDIQDDSDPIPLRIRESRSDPRHHDIDLTKQ